MKIEKHIAIPAPVSHGTGMTKMIQSMEIGDSCLLQKKQYASARVIAGRLSIKITSRAVSPEETRIWRTA
jgi:hypothetical protein